MEHLGVDQIGGHQTSIEQHGEQHQEVQNLPARQILTREGIGQHQGDRQTDGCSHYCDDNGRQIGPSDDCTVAPQIFISSQTELRRNERISVPGNRFLAGNGRGEHQHKGKNGRKRQQRQHNVGDDRHTGDMFFLFCCGIHTQNRLPSIFLFFTSQLENITKIKPTID